MEKKRSRDVTVFAILHFIIGFYIFMALGIASGPYPYHLEFIIPYLIPLLWIITGIGLLKLKEWARKSAIYLAIFIIIVTSIASFSNKGRVSIFSEVAACGFYFIIFSYFIYFFTRRKVKEQFQQEKTGTA